MLFEQAGLFDGTNRQMVRRFSRNNESHLTKQVAVDHHRRHVRDRGRAPYGAVGSDGCSTMGKRNDNYPNTHKLGHRQRLQGILAL